MKRVKRVFAIIIGLACLLMGSAAMAASINVTSDPGALGAEGGSVQLSISIANDSEYAMESITISNNGTRFFETSGVIIAPGETTAFSQSVSIPAAMLGQPIGFDIAWTENGEQKYSTASVTVLNSGAGLAEAALSVSVKASSSQASRGESITLTYTITNSGITPISGVSLTDKEIAGRQAMISDVTVEPGTPYVYIHEFTMGSSTVVSAPVITYTGADGSTVTVTGSEKTLGMVNSKISVSVTQGAASEEGQQFTIALTNKGNGRAWQCRKFGRYKPCNRRKPHAYLYRAHNRNKKRCIQHIRHRRDQHKLFRSYRNLCRQEVYRPFTHRHILLGRGCFPA